MSGDIKSAARCIMRQKKKIICVNDGPCEGFDARVELLTSAFDRILPQKCSFEVG
jgi:hypothetical protein